MKTNKKTIIARKKACPSDRRGFTLIEILVIIAIISILVTVILISMIGSREKAQDNSAFTSFKSIAAPAYMCLTSGSTTIKLTTPVIGNNICSVAIGDSQWPEFAKTGWDYTNFKWCTPGSNGNLRPGLSNPAELCGGYNDETCGGSSTTGYFCFMMQKGSENKYMWCTLEGCRKDF